MKLPYQDIEKIDTVVDEYQYLSIGDFFMSFVRDVFCTMICQECVNFDQIVNPKVR
jgi:hypothetical protein